MKISKRIVALAVAGAMVAGTVGLSASAQAAEITPVGTITITPTSGNVNTDVNFLDSIAVNVGAPTGFRALSSTVIFQNGVEIGAISQSRTTAMVSTAGTNGLDGNVVFMDRSIIPTNTFVSSKLLNGLTKPLATGNFELRYYYFASATAPNRATDPYVKLDMTYDATSGAWSLPAVVVPAVATTTSLTASATGSTVALSATVKKSSDSSVATAAAGSISFFEGATQVGSTQTVAAGLASVSLTAVTDGNHSYTAVFTPSDAAYSASTSASASVSLGALVAPAFTAAVPVAITFDIAAGTNGGVLQLTSRSSNVVLGTATIGTGTFNASGTLNAVVDDSRQAGANDWSLTGVMGNFTAPAVGTTPARTLSGKYLGWTPAVAAGSVGNAGAVVLPSPGSVNGLTVSSQLSYGSTSAAVPQVTTTTVSALLQLKAPKNTAAGNYAGVLTLTLI